MKVIIAGDFCPVNRAEKLLSDGVSIMSAGLQEYWNSADFRIANLECPVTDHQKKITKSGPCLKASANIFPALNQFQFSALSLANNHIMDFGKTGFRDTLKMLESSGIEYFGVEVEAKPHAGTILEKDRLKLAVLSYSISEFCLADDFDGNGARPIDLIKIINDLKHYRAQADHMVILLHMGLYMNSFPSPRQREICHFLVQQGAGAVLCQHSHVCGAYEQLGDAFISYGQGSFLFDLNKTGSHWNEGYLVELTLSSQKISAEIRGTRQFDTKPEIDLMSAEKEAELKQRLDRFNEILKDATQLKAAFRKEVERNRRAYYGMMIAPSGRLFNAVKRRINLGSLIPLSMKTVLLNLYRNEEHSEMIQEILKSDIHE